MVRNRPTGAAGTVKRMIRRSGGAERIREGLMRKWILTALAAWLVGAVSVPSAASADEAGATASRSVERTTVTRVRKHRIRVHRRHVRVYGRGPHLGRYFYCPPPENVCQLTPRLVWTPAGYQRVFYTRRVW